jgi:phospholipid/cholesterol/gamma-HCH transport system permease protein
MALLVTIGQMLSLSLWALVRLRFGGREMLRQVYETGNRSLLFVGITMAFIGMIGVYELASTMEAVLPEYSTLGAATLQGLTREMGPIMAGLLLATRVGTGMAAEIGSMQVSDQVDAMKLCSVDPVELLVLPRLFATSVASVGLAAVGTTIAFFAGMAVAWFGFSILPDSFMSLRFVVTADLIMGISKSLVFGFTVPLISCACGFLATGGSEGVGRATTRAVVLSSFVVILEDAFITYIGEVLQ